MSQPSYGNKWPAYAKQWDRMEVRPNKQAQFEKTAKKLIASKDRYLKAEKATGIPWYMIALLHMRESDNNFNTQLAQGDPLSRRSTHVPAGRGPFSTWEEGAVDALVTLKRFNKIIDWRLEKILYYSELYNGWGYHNHHVSSAYLWAGSTVYSGGKYVSDGVWSSTAVDSQPGVASVLKVMMKLDPSIKPKRESNLPDVKGPAAVIVAGGTAAAADPSRWHYYVAGALIVAGLTAVVIWWFKRRNKETPDVGMA